MIPVILKEINTAIFILSGLVSLGITLSLIAFIYRKSPSTRAEIDIKKLTKLILTIYGTINLFYFTNLIPPVPLALDAAIVAHNVEKQGDDYVVSFEQNEWYIFWRNHRTQYIQQPGESVYVFTSIFAPTAIKKAVFHRWSWYNESTKKWDVVDDLGYEITGGRDAGFRGYTYKSNVMPGLWKVDVVTEENLILGIIDFEIIMDSDQEPQQLVQMTF